MDLLSLYYFSEAAKDLHITNTAKRLYISQQSLSNHIQRLETAYGTMLFERKPKLKLTYSGEVFLSFAKKILAEDNNLRNELSDIEKQNKGILRIGASTPRLRVLVPEIIPIFMREFPQVKIHIVNAPSRTLEHEVETGGLDVAVGIFQSKNPNLECTFMHNDRVYLVVADTLLQRYYGDQTENLKKRCLHGAAVSDLAKLPFILPDQSNRLSLAISNCFDAAGCKPNVCMTATYPQFYFSLFTDGVAAGFVTQTGLLDAPVNCRQTTNVFPLYLNGRPIYHTISMLRNRTSYQPIFNKRFVVIMNSYFKNLGKKSMVSQL
ncbi:MAG: LysR family transcriptional regulator [Clostridiales bacterium]|jgi:DNA-binding transcriptional LysR family regulator|nr:LysR family transcriptional regulator [Clostridiales bacterium]